MNSRNALYLWVALFSITAFFLWLSDRTAIEGGPESVNFSTTSVPSEIKKSESIGGVHRSPLLQIEDEKKPGSTPDIEPPALNLNVTVFEEASGAKIQGVEIFFSDTGKERFIGSTNSLGELRFAATESGYLHTKKIPFASEQVWVELNGKANDTQIVQVQLIRGAEISGKISIDNQLGNFDLSSLDVIAWAMPQSAFSVDWDSILSGTPAIVHRVNPGSNGLFVLAGLDPEKRYSLIAGGAGYSVREVRMAVSPGDSSINLRVNPIYGCKIVASSDEKELTTSPSTMAYSFSWAPGAEKGRIIPRQDWRLRLAGLPVEMGMDLEELQVYAFAFSRDDELNPPGAIELRFDILGYEKKRLNCELKKIGGGLAEYGINLLPSQLEKGEVVVNWSYPIGRGPQPQSTSSECAFFYLITDLGWEFEYEIRDFSRPFRIPGVPYGNYSFRFQSVGRLGPNRDSLPSYSGEILVGQEGAEIGIDISSLGSLEIIPLLPGNAPYAGRMGCTLVWEKTGRSCFMAFKSRPFIISGLPEGEYTMSMNSTWPGVDPIEIIIEPIRIGRGERTEAKIFLPRIENQIF